MFATFGHLQHEFIDIVTLRNNALNRLLAIFINFLLDHNHLFAVLGNCGLD
jgi:hypothetical protein